MVDLGVYNFVKNALAAGKSKEEITADAMRGGQIRSEDLAQVFDMVASGKAPAAKAPDLRGERTGAFQPAAKSNRGYLIITWIALISALIVGLAALMEPQLLNVQSLIHGANLQYQKAETTVPSH